MPAYEFLTLLIRQEGQAMLADYNRSHYSPDKEDLISLKDSDILLPVIPGRNLFACCLNTTPAMTSYITCLVTRKVAGSCKFDLFYSLFMKILQGAS